jgi:hypothetical protein
MNDSKQSHHVHEGSESDGVRNGHRPYWKRAHHDWRFWVALVLMIGAISIYVMSNDFTFQSLSRQRTPLSGAVGK